MNEAMERITVESWTGPKEVTKEEFITIWVDHVKELTKLDYEYGLEVIEKVREKAGFEFERLYEAQVALEEL